MKPDELGIGVIGCGRFGLFAMQQFVQVPGVRLSGIAGTHRPAARAAAKRFGVPIMADVESLLRDARVDLVYKKCDVYQMIELTGGESDRKMHRYGRLLQALLADQLAWLRDRGHPRRVTEQNGHNSLAMAQEANRMISQTDAHPPL